MSKNNSAIIVFVSVIIICGFLSLMPAYSQVPYLPNVQSSPFKKSQNGTIITASNPNHNSSMAPVSKYSQRNTNSSSTSQSSNNNAKVVIINFDDSHKNQYTYAKPILDKYGFKATFFKVCNWVEAGHHD
jgi:peptidoglycan/xylan/chitin deacetylase (PgdA/CDA1 family)